MLQFTAELNANNAVDVRKQKNAFPSIFLDICDGVRRLTFGFENPAYVNQDENNLYGVRIVYPPDNKNTRAQDPNAFYGQYSLHLYDRDHYSSARAL